MIVAVGPDVSIFVTSSKPVLVTPAFSASIEVVIVFVKLFVYIAAEKLTVPSLFTVAPFTGVLSGNNFTLATPLTTEIL